MRHHYESPFLDHEALEFLRDADEQQQGAPSLPSELLEVEQYAEAEQLTEHQTRAPKRFQMTRQQKKLESYEWHDDQEAVTSDEAFTPEPIESQAPEDLDAASGELDDQLEATDESESDPYTAEWSAQSDDPETHENPETLEGQYDWELQLAESEIESELTDRPEPMPVPANNPVSFAQPPSTPAYWPVQTSLPEGREVNYRQADGTHVGRRPGRRFLAKRAKGKRAHVGVDLFARFNDAVVACEEGKIIAFYPFCCAAQKTSWALLVEHRNVVANYGEVTPDSLSRLGLKRGSKVQAGETIAYVGKNPRGTSMLHFETWSKGTTSTKQWIVGRKRPDGLLNPTKYLLALQSSASPVAQLQRNLESDAFNLSRESSDVVAFYASDDTAYENPVLSEIDDED